MKGATYVTVEADAAFVMPMNASGGNSTSNGEVNLEYFWRDHRKRVDL